ncbi:hypothetical protein [Butyrivibrio proteoclasticus]|uniref:hypothetical protein n=1 Tax=Butyrivibrio proteoclasticus TaxID=43305 RepID=UPI00047BFD10|nr:hypothetical protein [Butyrivibrio proteoclasticus]
MAIDNYRKLTLSKVFLFLYFIIMFGARAFGIMEGSLAYNIVLVIGAGSIFLRLISIEYTVFELIVISVIMAFSGLSYVLSGEKGILLYLCLMFGMKEIASKSVVKAAEVIYAIAFPVMAFLAITGIIHDTVWYIQRGVLGTSTDAIIRWSFGYHHSNVCHIVFLILCATFLYFSPNNKKRLIIDAIIVVAMNIILYFYTYSRTGLACAFLLIFMNLYFGLIKKIPVVVKALLVSVYPLIMAGSLLLPLLIKPGRLFDVLDKVTSWRLFKSYNFMHNCNLPLFGQRLNMDFATMLDNSYLYVIGQNGIVVAVIMLIINIMTVVYLIKQDNRKALALVVMIQAAGYMEPFMYNLSFRNIAFIFYGEAFYYYVRVLANRINNALLRKEFRILCLDKEINTLDGISNRIEEFNNKLTRAIYGNIVVVLIVSAIITGIAYLVINNTSQWPTVVYSCDVNADNYKEINEYLTLDEVNSIRENGGIVFNYKDEFTPVYKIPFDYGYIYHMFIYTKCFALFLLSFIVSSFGMLIRKKQIKQNA